VDLVDAERMARQLIAEHLDTRWTFKWDNAKTRLGACHHRNHTITLSKHFATLNGEDETRDTVLHEIAHALTPGVAHGPAWRKAAARIGARPVARADGRTLVKPVANWVAHCPRCAATLSRYRRSTTPVACARCCRRHNGGRFDRRFVLTWVPADAGGDGPPVKDGAGKGTVSVDVSSGGEASALAADEATRPADLAGARSGVAGRSGRVWPAASAAGPVTQLDLFADLEG
jgi:predicted SprT family Zn-dependent metalloprotease